MLSIILNCFLFFGSFSDYEYEYIKIINLQHKPIVEATLNGKKAFFLLDTGSDITIINQDDMQKYDFRLLQREGDYHQAIGVGGTTSDLSVILNVNLELGSTRIITSYMAHDLNSIIQNILSESGVKITGIIGADAMKRYGVVIDYKNKKVGLLTSKNRSQEDKTLLSKMK